MKLQICLLILCDRFLIENCNLVNICDRLVFNMELQIYLVNLCDRFLNFKL